MLINLDYSRVEVAADVGKQKKQELQERQNKNSKLFARKACVIKSYLLASPVLVIVLKAINYTGVCP